MLARLHRWWLPRFSLRFLLAAVSAFGIGFPIWYRWPYEERTEAHTESCGFRFGAVTTTWQRQWGGGRLKQGWETDYDLSGQPERRSYFRRDVCDGPYERFDATGRICERGQYAGGSREGIWTASDEYANSRWEYLRGKRHGEYTCRSGSYELHLQFDRGRLLSIDGEGVRFDADAAAMQLLGERLDSQPPFHAEFVETPLQQAAACLNELQSVPYFVSPDLDAELAISYWAPHFDLTLREELTILAQVHGLALRGRYGGICFTTPDESQPWRDPTGISELVPPPNSPWASAGELRASLQVDGLPLAAALGKLLAPLNLPFDAARIQPTPDAPAGQRLWLSIPERPLRDVLGILLFQSGCRCELGDGTLVIVPQR